MSDLLALLPPDALEGLRKLATIGDKADASDVVWLAGRVVADPEDPIEAPNVAFLIQLLIEAEGRCQGGAARVAALEAGLRAMVHDGGYARTELLGTGGHGFTCAYCQRCVGDGDPIADIRHRDDCPVPAARTLLDSAPEVRP